jgi:hypothetical protein
VIGAGADGTDVVVEDDDVVVVVVEAVVFEPVECERAVDELDENDEKWEDVIVLDKLEDELEANEDEEAEDVVVEVLW